MKELNEMVKREAEEIKALFAGLDEAEQERRSEQGEPIDLYDYIAEALDIEYRLDSQFQLIGVTLYVTFGGPTIGVDTYQGEVKGTWGTESESAWLPSEIADEILDIVQETMAERDGCPF